MIILDQRRMPHIPSDQLFWSEYPPAWVTATVRDDGTVALDAPGAEPLALARWVASLPAFSHAVVGNGGQ